MADDLAIVDTNVLVYALFHETAQHASARSLLDRARQDEIRLCLVPQILVEFYAVVTDPRRVSAARQPAETIDAIERILAIPGVSLLPVPPDLVPRWLDLARRYPLTRGAVFDLQLVATMLGNAVTRIYTFDQSHFARFAELTLLSP